MVGIRQWHYNKEFLRPKFGLLQKWLLLAWTLLWTDHRWFQVFLIVEQNSLTIIDVVLFAMPWTSPHIYKKIRLPSYAKAIAILISIGMLCFMCVFFCSRLEPTTLINEQNVSYICLLPKHLFKKAPKKLILHVSHHLFIFRHVVNFWCHVPCYELLMPCHMLRTFDTMSTNSMKNNIALIILQCCSTATCCKCNNLCNH